MLFSMDLHRSYVAVCACTSCHKILSLLKLFFSFDLSIIFFLSSLVMNELLLCLNIFVFKGAFLSQTSKKVFSKTPYVLLSFILSRFILRVSLKVSILKFLYKYFFFGGPLKLHDFIMVTMSL